MQDYIQFVSEIKETIIKSKYKAASLANREMLLLYYHTAYKLSDKIKKSNWGAGIVRNISDNVPKELSGLRGFSFRNLQNMKQFYEQDEILYNRLLPEQNQSFAIVPSATAQIDNNGIMPLITAQTENKT